MPIKIDRSGLDRLIKNAKELDGKHQVKMIDVLNPEFVSAHSKFDDLESLFAASGFKIDGPDDFAAIPDDQWDAFITANTDFDNWAEMQKAGHLQYVSSRLKKGL